MKPEFRFHYGEKEYTLAAVQGAVYELDEGVSVQVEAKAHERYDAVEWVLWLENGGTENSAVFSDILDCDTLLPFSSMPAARSGYRTTEGDACVIAMGGMVPPPCYWENDAVAATEFAPRREYLDKAEDKTKRFANTGALSAQGTMPFFDVTADGEGYILAIGWTGDWRAEFTKCEDGIRAKTGLKNTGFYLLPGERVRTSRTLIMQYSASEDKYNKFRRLIKNHFSHKSGNPARRDGLLAYELWGGLPSEEMKKRLCELREHGVRFEDVWVDAGWYGECTDCIDAFVGDWHKNTGNWTVNPHPHPGGLLDVSECARAAGMQMLLWIEPERAVVGTPITKEHPEWFTFLENDTSAILNYGLPEARKYAVELILSFVRRFGLSCYRQDFNLLSLVEYFAAADGENRRGITEIKHVTGMYEVWDAVLAEEPELIIDNCSGGGRRIDIETLSRSIPFFRTDYQCNYNVNPEVLQTHNAGVARYLPYTGCTTTRKSDVYTQRSAYSSSWGGAFYDAVFCSMSEEDFAWAKNAVEEYRRIRHYFHEDFYNHGTATLDPTSWAIFQYHDPETESGVLLAFRRSASPFDRVKVTLGGLQAGAEYEVENLNDGEKSIFIDALDVYLPEKRSSVIFEYKLKK